VPELQPRQPGIEPVLRYQFRMGALFDDSPLIDDQDPVAGQHRGEAMGDHQRRFRSSVTRPSWTISSPDKSRADIRNSVKAAKRSFLKSK
jgi:hypothetical protein